MKIIKLKDYDRRLYAKIEEYHLERVQKKIAQGFKQGESETHNLTITPVYIDRFRWKCWPDVNLYRILFSLHLLEDLGVINLISENKFKFIGGKLPENKNNGGKK